MKHFNELAGLLRWVPYKMVWNPDREKFDKIPSLISKRLSTNDPAHWLTLDKAQEKVGGRGISGVGLVMTGSIRQDGYVLLGFDFDGVDFYKFKTPLKTYSEYSPSKTGLRMFGWVPVDWAERFKDTTNCKLKHCDHCEIYLGTSPRFLTVTGDVFGDMPIARLTLENLAVIESWGLKPADRTKGAVSMDMLLEAGQPIPLTDLSPDQRHLVDGTGRIDRSAVVLGLVIKLIDTGHSLEDVLATLLSNEAIRKYLLDHRGGDPDKAVKFAKEEIGRAYANSNAGMKAALVGYNPAWAVEQDETPAEETQPFPMELFNQAPGIVGDIARWLMQASYTPRAPFAYACALSMTACLIGPNCTHGSRDGKLNLYIVLVGETGVGKNEAFDMMIKLLNATDAKDCVADFPASEAALRRQLNLSPNMLIRVDELSHKLDSMKNSSNGSLLGKTILEMYNGARLPAKAYADEKKSLPAVENPFVQIIGGTTDKVWDTVRSSHMEDGTLNRFVFAILESAEYVFNPEPNISIPKELQDKLNAFFRGGRMCDLIGYVPPGFGRKVAYAEDVKAAVIELNRTAWEYQQQEYGSLYTRLVQNTTKVAAILAVGDGRLTVNMSDFLHARKFMEWSIRNTLIKVSARMADTNFERLTKRLLTRLTQLGGRMALRDAYRHLHITRREMEELTTTLVMSEEIYIVTEENSSKAGGETEYIVKAKD